MKRFGVFVGLLALVNIAVLATDLKVVIINRHHMVSLSSFADRFGVAIDYSSTRDGISMKLADRVVDVVPYNRTAWVDGAEVTLDQPVVILDDTTYLPLRFMCVSFGLGYTCHDEDSQVVVVDNYSNSSCFFVIDWGWSRYDHVWCYDYDCHGYHNWHHNHDVMIAHHGNMGFHPVIHNVHHIGEGSTGNNQGSSNWNNHVSNGWNNQGNGGWYNHGNGAATGVPRRPLTPYGYQNQSSIQHTPWYQSHSSLHTSGWNRGEGTSNHATSHSKGSLDNGASSSTTSGSSRGGERGHDR